MSHSMGDEMKGNQVAVPTVPLWINNQPHTSNITFPVVNAENDVVVHRVYSATPELARKAVESADRAFQAWRDTKPWHRRTLLLKAAEYLEERRKEVAEMARLEVPMAETMVNAMVDLSIELLHELAGAISQATSGVVPHTRGDDTFAVVLKEPYGVQLGIAPWNSSLFLAMRSVLTPIACGNTAVLKASELSPRTHQFIGRMLADVGFPPGTLNVIQSRREDALEILEALVSQPAVKKVNFTGSTAVGQIVAERAARHCKPVLMELGGKAPQIVLHDADLDEAAQAAVTGAFFHHGQICMSTETVLAHRSIVEALTEKMACLADSWPMTSAVSEVGVAKAESLIQDALRLGSVPATTYHATSNSKTTHEADEERGLRLRLNKSTLRPVILTKLTPDMRIYSEESFGPSVSVLEFDTDQEAIRLVNESSYGLSSSVFTRNIPRALSMARKIEAGAVHINSMTVHDEPQLPHGGTKFSGWGRFGVPWGFDEFLQLKTITIKSKDLQP